MNCTAKHTKYQPTDAEWKCPECGTPPPDGFCIDEPADGHSDDCPKLHVNDGLYCYKCKASRSGGRWAAALQKAANMVDCPHCKGRGLVSKVEG